jgi:sigma-B regulation protein RsbU (phosphoserine phosphatase)
MNSTSPERMECMEVWGGNLAVHRQFAAPGLNVWIHSRPYGQALGGGDVYYLSSCASGRITRMLLADISGHGVLVAQLATKLRDLMRRNVNFIRQSRFVREMNRQFGDFGEQSTFATALVATFFAPTRSFTLCNAGHPAPLVYRRSTSQWSELASEGDASPGLCDLPLGVADHTNYGQLKAKLETGDLVLCFSDAVTESLGSDGRQLGREGVLQLVRELDVARPADLVPALIERIERLSADNLSQDDATLLLCEATGGGSTLKANLLAPFRLLGPVSDRTQFT